MKYLSKSELRRVYSNAVSCISAQYLRNFVGARFKLPASITAPQPGSLSLGYYFCGILQPLVNVKGSWEITRYYSLHPQISEQSPVSPMIFCTIRVPNIPCPNRHPTVPPSEGLPILGAILRWFSLVSVPRI